MKSIFLVLSLLLTLLPRLSVAAPADGWFHPPVSSTWITAMAVQPWDGKILVAGQIDNDQSWTPVNLMRLNPDGTLDPSFTATLNSGVYAMILLPDRSVIAIGMFTEVDFLKENGDPDSLPCKGIVRLDTNGRPDTSFDPCRNGGGFDLEVVNAVALMPDGKSILVGGGFTSVGGVDAPYLARISLDSASYGEITAVPAHPNDWVNTILVQDDHRILIGGYFTEISDTPHPSLARLNADGTLDGSFTAGSDGALNAIEQQPDGKIIIGGDFSTVYPTSGGEAQHGFVARLTREGEIDDDYDPVPATEEALVFPIIFSLKLQPNGQLLMGGGFSKVSGRPHPFVARLNPDGVPDDTFSPAVEGVISAIAVQPDGKVVLGVQMGSGSEAAVTRYYPDGTPDSSVEGGALPNGQTWALALQPDGMLTVGGQFNSLGTGAQLTPRPYVARLKPDWKVADAAQFDPVPAPQKRTLSLALQPDWKMWIGGDFWLVNPAVNGERAPHLARVTGTGARDPAPYDVQVNGETVQRTFYQNVQALMLAHDGMVFAMALLPKGSPYEGRGYVGGYFVGDSDHDGTVPEFQFLRLKEDGERDTSFNAGDVMTPPTADPATAPYLVYTGRNLKGRVTAIAIQPDGKVLAAVNGFATPNSSSTEINAAVLVRFLPDSGLLDPDWTYLTVNGEIDSVALQRDGQIVIAGSFKQPVNYNGTVYLQQIVRLNNGRADPLIKDGTLDESLVLTATHTNSFEIRVWDVSLQSDGGMVIAGVFDALTDRQGTVSRDCFAKIDANGTVDRDYDLGALPVIAPNIAVTSAILQPDGKVVIGGGFTSVNGVAARHNLARFNNSKAALQSLAISPDGSSISWLRDGSAPELWGVTFEDSTDRQHWTYLGKGTAIAATAEKSGGWGMTVTQPIPKNELHYLRARGWGVSSSRNSVLVEETRQYFLSSGKQEQTIDFGTLPTKTYGDPDFPAGGHASSDLPVTYTSSNTDVAVIVGEQIHIVGAGVTTITATQPGDAAYNPAPAVPAQTLTVEPALLTVKADDQTRPYGSPNPDLTVTYSGFVYGEGPAVLVGPPRVTTTATRWSDAGSYLIKVETGEVVTHNYRCNFLNGTLSITRVGQCITFPLIGDRTYGDVFTVTAVACSGGPVTFESSPPGVVQVNGNTFTAVGTGTVTITAREEGDDNFEEAYAVSQTVVVHKAGQQVNFPPLGEKVVGDPPFQLTASTTSGLAVSYDSSNTAVAQVAGSTVTIVGAGTTVITARQDGNGNFDPASSVSQTLTVAQEGAPPLVTLSTLSSGAVTASPVLNLQGMCLDPSGLAGVTLNGIALGSDPGMFSLPLLLTAGSNTVTLSALDRAGNRTTESRVVILKGDGPSLAIGAPADNSVTADPQLLLQGTAADGSIVTATVNGSPAQRLALVGGAFSTTAMLTAGVNTIEVSAEAGGAKSMLKRSVICATGKPGVAITEPVQDLRIEGGSVVVAGTVSGNGVAVTLSVNGVNQALPLTGGRFRQEIPLVSLGTYRITATATSAAGSSVAYRNILRTAAVRGDLNGDGGVDVGDARTALLIALRLQPVTAEALAHADVAPLMGGVPQPDGVVDAGDVVVLLRKVVGLVDF